MKGDTPSWLSKFDNCALNREGMSPTYERGHTFPVIKNLIIVFLIGKEFPQSLDNGVRLAEKRGGKQDGKSQDY